MAADYSDVLERFEEALLAKVELGLTPAQKKLIVENIYWNNKGYSESDLADVKSACFFVYEELEEAMLDSIWEYGLSSSDLEEKVEQSEVVPFCAMNMNGLDVYWGQDCFQENNNWGILCLDIKNGKNADCPVIWAYKGKLIPWAASAASMNFKVIEKVEQSDDEEGDDSEDSDE